MCGICGFTGELLNRDRVLKDMADKLFTVVLTAADTFLIRKFQWGFAD